jgi:hypothetical protein
MSQLIMDTTNKIYNATEIVGAKFSLPEIEFGGIEKNIDTWKVEYSYNGSLEELILGNDDVQRDVKELVNIIVSKLVEETEINVDIITFGEFVSLHDNNQYSPFIMPNDVQTRDRNQVGVVYCNAFIPITISTAASRIIHSPNLDRNFTESSDFPPIIVGITLQELSHMIHVIHNITNVYDVDDVVYFKVYPQFIEARLLYPDHDYPHNVWCKVINGGAAPQEKLMERKSIALNLLINQVEHVYKLAKQIIEEYSLDNTMRFEVKPKKISVKIKINDNMWAEIWKKPIN